MSTPIRKCCPRSALPSFLALPIAGAARNRGGTATLVDSLCKASKNPRAHPTERVREASIPRACVSSAAERVRQPVMHRMAVQRHPSATFVISPRRDRMPDPAPRRMSEYRARIARRLVHSTAGSPAPRSVIVNR